MRERLMQMFTGENTAQGDINHIQNTWSFCDPKGFDGHFCIVCREFVKSKHVRTLVLHLPLQSSKPPRILPFPSHLNYRACTRALQKASMSRSTQWNSNNLCQETWSLVHISLPVMGFITSPTTSNTSTVTGDRQKQVESGSVYAMSRKDKVKAVYVCMLHAFMYLSFLNSLMFHTSSHRRWFTAWKAAENYRTYFHDDCLPCISSAATVCKTGDELHEARKVEFS